MSAKQLERKHSRAAYEDFCTRRGSRRKRCPSGACRAALDALPIDPYAAQSAGRVLRRCVEAFFETPELLAPAYPRGVRASSGAFYTPGPAGAPRAPASSRSGRPRPWPMTLARVRVPMRSASSISLASSSVLRRGVARVLLDVVVLDVVLQAHGCSRASPCSCPLPYCWPSRVPVFRIGGHLLRPFAVCLLRLLAARLPPVGCPLAAIGRVPNGLSPFRRLCLAIVTGIDGHFTCLVLRRSRTGVVPGGSPVGLGRLACRSLAPTDSGASAVRLWCWPSCRRPRRRPPVANGRRWRTIRGIHKVFM